jgi:hypothetical protein
MRVVAIVKMPNRPKKKINYNSMKRVKQNHEKGKEALLDSCCNNITHGITRSVIQVVPEVGSLKELPH